MRWAAKPHAVHAGTDRKEREGGGRHGMAGQHRTRASAQRDKFHNPSDAQNTEDQHRQDARRPRRRSKTSAWRKKGGKSTRSVTR